MNRLVLALAIVVLAGAVVAGVRQNAEAEVAPDNRSVEEKVQDLQNKVSYLEWVAFPPMDPNLPQPGMVDPLSRLSLVSGSEYRFVLSCSYSEGYGVIDLVCARPFE